MVSINNNISPVNNIKPINSVKNLSRVGKSEIFDVEKRSGANNSNDIKAPNDQLRNSSNLPKLTTNAFLSLQKKFDE